MRLLLNHVRSNENWRNLIPIKPVFQIICLTGSRVTSQYGYSRAIVCYCSIHHGIVPTAWKQAYIVPVPKTNPQTDITKDLPPISLTPTVFKVLESFLGQWILNELEGKLDNCQYGALRSRSTTHELIDILHHWHEALDNNSSIRAITNSIRRPQTSAKEGLVVQNSYEAPILQ